MCAREYAHAYACVPTVVDAREQGRRRVVRAALGVQRRRFRQHRQSAVIRRHHASTSRSSRHTRRHRSWCRSHVHSRRHAHASNQPTGDVPKQHTRTLAQALAEAGVQARKMAAIPPGLRGAVTGTLTLAARRLVWLVPTGGLGTPTRVRPRGAPAACSTWP
jgi:hypothetical protein